MNVSVCKAGASKPKETTDSHNDGGHVPVSVRAGFVNLTVRFDQELSVAFRDVESYSS